MAAITPILLGVITYLTERARREAVAANKAVVASSKEVSKAADTVAKTLVVTTDGTSAKLDAIAVTSSNSQRMGEAIHTLVNSDRGKLLALNAMQARRIASMSGAPEDAAIAAEAERVLAQHVNSQAQVDARPSPSPTDSGHAQK